MRPINGLRRDSCDGDALRDGLRVFNCKFRGHSITATWRAWWAYWWASQCEALLTLCTFFSSSHMRTLHQFKAHRQINATNRFPRTLFICEQDIKTQIICVNKFLAPIEFHGRKCRTTYFRVRNRINRCNYLRSIKINTKNA